MSKNQQKTRAELLAEFNAAPDDALFDQKMVGAVRGCSDATMERDRWAGTGIPFIKINGRVRYKKRTIIVLISVQNLPGSWGKQR